MREHHLSVTRTARYMTLGEPGPAVREMWFVLHGYGQLAGSFLRQFEALDDGARLIVAPEGMSRFYLGRIGQRPPTEQPVGASWMTREDRLVEIADYVRYLDAVYADVLRRLARDAVHVTALGFSQGAATVSRWAALGDSKIDHAILWGGELPPDLDLGAARERWRSMRFTVVHGTQDLYITQKVVEGLAARLREHGIPHVVCGFAGGHELHEGVLREILDRE